MADDAKKSWLANTLRTVSDFGDAVKRIGHKVVDFVPIPGLGVVKRFVDGTVDPLMDGIRDGGLYAAEKITGSQSVKEAREESKKISQEHWQSEYNVFGGNADAGKAKTAAMDVAASIKSGGPDAKAVSAGVSAGLRNEARALLQKAGVSEETAGTIARTASSRLHGKGDHTH